MEFLKKFNKIEEYLGGTLFLCLFVLLIVQIFMSNVGSPLSWSFELSKLIFVYIGLLGVSLGVRTQQHVLVDFICNYLPSTIKKIVFSVIQILIFICVVLFIHFGMVLFQKAQFPIQSLGITQKWLYFPLLSISILMLVRFFQAQYDNYKNNISLIPSQFFIVVSIIAIALFFYNPSIYEYLYLGKYFDLGNNTIYYALIVWLVVMFLGMPVGWSLFFSAILFFAFSNWKLSFHDAKSLVKSINGFILLSVPFFVLTGILMNSSGITERIFNFAKAMLGHRVGGMGHVNISASLIFSGMSGSALADAGGLGQLEIKAMRDAGYDDDVCGGITAASCIIGPLVPPSIAMIIYGVIANQSIAKLFLAGFVPGILLTIALMIMNTYICKKRKYPLAPKASKSVRKEAFKKAFLPMLTPVIIIGGIFSGVFTPTESAVIAALYSVILGFYYGELSFKKLFANVVEATAVSGVIVLMVMTVTFFGKMIAREQVAMQVAEGFMSVASTTIMVLIMINLLLLFLGMFIDALALQFLVLPMLIPIAQQFDINLIFFGVMTTLNMMIGILTPPMGMALFVVARVGNMTVSTVTKGVIPFIIPIFLTLVLITIFPQIITFVPNLIMP